LIDELGDFIEERDREIDILHSFVLWLNGLDELSPCVLFTHPPWSTTQLSERCFRVEKCDEAQIQRSMETVFGLRLHGMPTLAMVRSEMESEWAESVDPEYQGSSPITFQKAFSRASRKILNEFALYFSKIRDSVELVRSELDSFSRGEILRNEEFLNLFIAKVLPKHRLECDLWDFKRTIGAWHNTRLEELKVDFACNVAAFANSRGGLIIIGISDDRETLGVEECEIRIQQSRSILERYLDRSELIGISSMPIQDNRGNTVNCVIIRIPQSKDPVGVSDTSGMKYLFPVRMDDGIRYRSPRQVSEMKEDIGEDNFAFAGDMASFVYDG